MTDHSFVGADVYVSVDVEADGPLPLVHSMLSFGACVAGSFDGERFVREDQAAQTFSVEMRPIGTEFVPEALAVSGLDRDRLLLEGTEPATALADFADWLAGATGEGRPVLVAYPASYDWPWIAAYLERFAPGRSPFGYSGVLDMKTMYATKAGVRIGRAVKRRMPKFLLSSRPHTHHALDDAVEQADLSPT